MKLNKILTFILVFVLMLTCVSINTLADDNVAYLDLESTETYKDSKDLDQNYTFTQTGDVTYTDVTKVKLTWTINDIAATYTSHKTWDPTNLQWVEAKEDINVTHSGASFTLTNYSSTKVIGTVSFEAESALKDTFTSATFDDNNGKEIDTMVNSDYTVDETKKTNVPSNTITATLAFDNDKFADLTATASATKYGTYTVTITTAPKVVAKCLAFIANEDNSSITPSFASGTFKYSTDEGKNWTDGVNGTEIPLAKAGDKVMIKGNNCTTDAFNHFAMTGSISAEGDVTSLTNELGGDVNLAEAYPNLDEVIGCYQYMFSECAALTKAPALPSTVLCHNCYEGMFEFCTNLLSAPTLPATTMTEYCYVCMFMGCTSLKVSPELPAEKLAKECYRSMFYDCKTLKVAPALPATELQENCYKMMFKGCTWLFETPALPATVLPSGCYQEMFCESGIKTITALPEIESYGNECLSSMFNACDNLKVQEGGTMPEGGGKIFTCTTDSAADVEYMLGMTITPTKGTTYYYIPNNDVYRLEIVLENCEVLDATLFYTVTSETSDWTIELKKSDEWSYPESAVVTGGVSTSWTKYTGPMAQAKKGQIKLNISVTNITADATITITATKTTN